LNRLGGDGATSSSAARSGDALMSRATHPTMQSKEALGGGDDMQQSIEQDGALVS
jgi:hypothetical protein